MKTPLRDLPDGCRFELLRTGQKFKLVTRAKIKNRTVFKCLRYSDGQITSLNHQCIVSPIIKPRIKLKSYAK